MLVESVIFVSLVILLLAAKVDWRTGEVPENLSMGLLGFVVFIALAHSVAAWDYNILLRSLFWGFMAFAVSYTIYYLGHWGGGDVKLLAGIGCLIGYLDSTGFVWPNGGFFGYAVPPLATYAVNMALLSTPFVVVYTAALGVRHPAVFKVYLMNLRGRSVFFALVLAFLLSPVVLYLGLYSLSLVYAFVPGMLLLSVYVKTVEDSIMTRTIRVSELRDWDILAEDVVADGVTVAQKGNIEGVTPDEVNKIRELSQAGKIPEAIKTKKGVEFVPVLFLSLPVTLYIGNVLDIVLRVLFKIH